MFHSKIEVNMNNKIITAAVALAAMSCMIFTGCSQDRLDIEQHGVTSTSKYALANDSEALQFISSVYYLYMGDSFNAVLSGGHSTYRTLVYQLSTMGGESADYFKYMDTAESSTYSAIWSYFYKIAYWCGEIVEEMPENKVASAEVRDRVIAEARALRAISMMYLVQLYGNPPLADHILTGSESNTPAQESWAFIESELAKAAEALPSKANLGGQAAIGGRLTKEAAYAYLGKAQLWQGHYDDAAKTLYNNVIATGKYELYKSFEGLNSSKADFCDEYLWEFDFSDQSGLELSQAGMFDVYCFSPVVSKWNTKYATAWLPFGLGSNPTAESVSFFESHDGASERVAGTYLSYNDIVKSDMAKISLPMSNCEGYIKVKELCLEEDLVGADPQTYSKRNQPYMRYAEVLLNYAEAVAQGGTAGSLSGLEALNMVRRRAGLSDAAALSMDGDTGVKAERRAELYCEGHRFIDLVRWGDAASALSKTGVETVTFLGANADGSYNVSRTPTGGSGFQSGKHELFPIPSTDINQNPALTQNKGW